MMDLLLDDISQKVVTTEWIWCGKWSGLVLEDSNGKYHMIGKEPRGKWRAERAEFLYPDSHHFIGEEGDGGLYAR